ncbi:uncharacterized protein CYBJADRAFT_168224, partial [Cyberlindnera jadinii NRRL Y-1542]
MDQHLPNGSFYGVRPYGVMVGSSGSEFSSSECNGESIAGPETSSPRDALPVLHQAVTTPPRIGHIDMTSQSTSDQADTSITNSDRKLDPKLTREEQKEAVQELLNIHIDFLVGNERSEAWETVRRATGISVAKLKKLKNQAYDRGERIHKRIQTAKRTKTGSTTATVCDDDEFYLQFYYDCRISSIASKHKAQLLKILSQCRNDEFHLYHTKRNQYMREQVIESLSELNVLPELDVDVVLFRVLSKLFDCDDIGLNGDRELKRLLEEKRKKYKKTVFEPLYKQKKHQLKKAIMMRENAIKEKKEYKATLVKAINENLAFMSNTKLRDSIIETMRLIAEQEAKAESLKKSVMKTLESQEDIDSFEEFVSEESDIPA